ncbi:retrovirus-related pol polyprotein from transposon TNT 1-94 [Tanacetum coccineum]
MGKVLGYYLKHEINKKIIEDLIDNHKYNDSLLATRLGKIDNETYTSLPVGPMYDAILKKKLAKKDERGGNFVIACSIRRLNYMNALVDQGSDVNIMPLSVYNKLTSKKPIGTNIRLYLANHSYVYPLGIAKDVLVDVVGFVYPMDFVILDIKEDDYMTFILGTPFLTTARAVIKCDKGSMTLKAGRLKVRFVRTLRFPSKIKERIKRDPDPMIPANYVTRRILEWEERIENCQEDEIEFSKWRSKVFDDKNLV